VKILHVIGSLAPRYGGPSHVLPEMSVALAAKGHEVEVFTTNIDGGAELDVQCGVRVAVNDRVHVTYHAVQRPRSYIVSTSLARSLVRRIREFDVVHVHSLFLWHGLVTCALGRRFQVPYVMRPHGTLDPYHAARHRMRKAVYWSLVERCNFEGAAGVHCTSEAEAEHVRAAGVTAEPFVIPLGVDVASYECSSGVDSVEQNPELLGKSLVTFIGRLTEKKGLDLLLQAFSSVLPVRPDAHLVIAGPDDEGLGRVLRRHVSNLGLGRHVTMLPLLGERDKILLLRRSTVFALPSADENFALAALEAMAAGTPVLITDGIPLHREVAEANAGIIVSRTIPALADGLARLLGDQREAARLGANARSLARARYSWDRVGRDLERMYAEVAAGSPAPDRTWVTA
jgi:glycosyltransferase involved in cell wall biosynthesis